MRDRQRAVDRHRAVLSGLIGSGRCAFEGDTQGLSQKTLQGWIRPAVMRLSVNTLWTDDCIIHLERGFN